MPSSFAAGLSGVWSSWACSLAAAFRGVPSVLAAEFTATCHERPPKVTESEGCGQQLADPASAASPPPAARCSQPFTAAQCGLRGLQLASVRASARCAVGRRAGGVRPRLLPRLRARVRRPRGRGLRRGGSRAGNVPRAACSSLFARGHWRTSAMRAHATWPSLPPVRPAHPCGRPRLSRSASAALLARAVSHRLLASRAALTSPRPRSLAFSAADQVPRVQPAPHRGPLRPRAQLHGPARLQPSRRSSGRSRGRSIRRGRSRRRRGFGRDRGGGPAGLPAAQAEHP